jgi:translation initiation factor IF-1
VIGDSTRRLFECAGCRSRSRSHKMTSATSFSRITVRTAFNSVQVLLEAPSATVQQLKHHLARTFSSASDQLRVVRKGALLKDSALLADGDAVAAVFACRGGSACVESPVSPCSPFFGFDYCDHDESDGSGELDGLSAHVGSMKTLRRLQSSAPKSSVKLFGNRSNLLSSDYADLALGFTPPKLRSKAAKTSATTREEQAAADFEGALPAGLHRGVVELAAGKNFRVRSLLDNRVRDCRIKGLLKRHVQVNSVVVFEPSLKFSDDEHGDIVWRHFDREVEKLQELGLLPESDVLWPKPAAAQSVAAAAAATSRKVKTACRAA